MKKLFLLIPLLLLSGCSRIYESDMFAMDTVISVKIDGNEQGMKAIKNEIERIDKKFSPQSEVILDDETNYLIEIADTVSENTNGSFNVQLADLMELWGFRGENPHVPDKAEIVDAISSAKYDFGGIAKGYAGERIARIAVENNIKSGIVSLGGNVQAIGTNHGKPWIVGVTDPENPEKSIGTLRVSNKAVVTSGGYQRYFEENGIKYHHIIDPKTGYPADAGLLSVTVIADNGTLADALSTAFFVSGKDKVLECYNSGVFSFEAVMVERDGTIITTDNADFHPEKE